MDTDAGDISRRTLDGLACLQLKLLTQIAGVQSGVHATLFARLQALQTNPVARPLRLVEQADAKAPALGPRSLALISIYLHLPRAERAARQRFALIANPQLFVAADLARVP